MNNIVSEEFYRQYLKDKKKLLGLTYDELSTVVGTTSGGVMRKYMDGYRRITQERFDTFKSRIEEYEKNVESIKDSTDLCAFLRREKNICSEMFSSDYKDLIEMLFNYLECQAMKLNG